MTHRSRVPFSLVFSVSLGKGRLREIFTIKQSYIFIYKLYYKKYKKRRIERAGHLTTRLDTRLVSRFS